MEPHQVDTRVRLDRNWCPEGISLIEAAKTVELTSASIHPTLLTEAIPADERRAALNLLLLTGAEPEVYDTGGRQSAVDLLLRLPHGRIEVAEVTSTIDRMQKTQLGYAHQVEAFVGDFYQGENAWIIHLTHGWKFSSSKKTRLREAKEIARKLSQLDELTAPITSPVAGSADSFPEIAANIRGWISPNHEPGAQFVSFNANTANPPDEPYLCRLSGYLNSSDLVARKIKKLGQAAATFQADRSHLYLLMSSIGSDGTLLPLTPAYFTQGDFIAPAGLTDLWLDGGNGAIYHWSETEGWAFHRANTASSSHKRLV